MFKAIKVLTIPAGSRVSFNENISFIAKTDKLEDKYSAELKLKDSVSILKSNPGLRLHIVENVTVKKSSNLIAGNSDAALDQTNFSINGSSSTARYLMNKKADAVRKILLGVDGIDATRITLSHGYVRLCTTNQTRNTKHEPQAKESRETRNR